MLPMPLSEILNYLFGSTTIVAIFIAWKTRKSEMKKIEALSNQEVSKSDQEKIITADKALDLINKLTERMDLEMEKSNREISKLEAKLDNVEKELNLYKNQCSKCSNNKIGK